MAGFTAVWLQYERLKQYRQHTRKRVRTVAAINLIAIVSLTVLIYWAPFSLPWSATTALAGFFVGVAMAAVPLCFF